MDKFGRLFLILSMLAPQTAVAGAAADDFKLFEQEAQVVTASRKSEKISEAPATVIVITHEDIRLRGYENLKDVLRDLPGMETIENYFSEQGTLVPVRGVAGNNKIIVLVNGMRVNPPGGEEMMLRSDFSVRDAERIEVVYGAGSTLYGNDAISAVINVITRKPTETREAGVNAGGGNHGFVEGGADFSQKWDALSLSGYVQASHSGLSDLSKQYPAWWQINQNFAQNKGSGTAPYRRDDGYNAFLRLEGKGNSLQIWHRESARSSAEGGYTGILAYIPQAVWHDRTTTIEGKNNSALSDALDLESTLTYSRYEVDPQTRYVTSLDGKTWYLDDFKYAIGTGFTWEERMSWRMTDRASLTGGVTLSNFDILPKATVPGGADPNGNIAQQAGSLSYYTAAGRVDIPRVNNVKYQQYGVYLESNWQVLSRLKLILGARVDKNTRYSNLPFSPRAAAVYSVADGLTAKYIYTRAYVSPAPYYEFNVFDNGSAINTVNPNLKPETAQSHEVNVSLRKEGFSGNLSAYVTHEDNLIVVGDQALPVNIVNPQVFADPGLTSARKLTQSANAGSSRSQGFDLFANYKIGRASLWSSYSYVDFVTWLGNLKTGLNQISRHNARWGMTYAVRRNLWVTPSLSYRSTPDNLQAAALSYNLGGEIKNPYQVNLYTLYQPIQALEIFANLQNLTNNRYALRGVLGPTPQETLSVSVGVRCKL